jgi:hypothetical protein
MRHLHNVLYAERTSVLAVKLLLLRSSLMLFQRVQLGAGDSRLPVRL